MITGAEAVVISSLVQVLGSGLSGGFTSMSQEEQNKKAMQFQATQNQLNRDQSERQFNLSLAQRNKEFAAEAPARAVNVFSSLKPSLDESRRKKDLTSAWSYLGSRK